MTQVYRRITETDEEAFQEDLVVLNTETQAVVTLNGTARIVWDALAEGTSLADLVDLFAEAFPGADRETLESDARALLARLDDAGLLAAATAAQYTQ